jgi:hypothetical protein
LEETLQLVWGGEEDQALHQTRAGLAVGNLELLAVGLLPDAGEEHGTLVGVGKLVQLEHFVCALEVLLLVLIEHAVEGHGAGAGDAIDCLVLVGVLFVVVLVVVVLVRMVGVGVVVLLQHLVDLVLSLVALGVGIVVLLLTLALLLLATAALSVLGGHGAVSQGSAVVRAQRTWDNFRAGTDNRDQI